MQLLWVQNGGTSLTELITYTSYISVKTAGAGGRGGLWQPALPLTMRRCAANARI